MNAKNIPAEGWTEPDERGHISYVTHAPAHSTDAPKREGYEPFFIGVHGNDWTRWTYRPVAKA